MSGSFQAPQDNPSLAERVRHPGGGIGGSRNDSGDRQARRRQSPTAAAQVLLDLGSHTFSHYEPRASSSGARMPWRHSLACGQLWGASG